MDIPSEIPSLVSLAGNAILGFLLKRLSDDRKQLMERVRGVEEKTEEIGSINTQLKSLNDEMKYIRGRLDKLLEVWLTNKQHGTN